MPRGPRSRPAHPAQTRAFEGINDVFIGGCNRTPLGNSVCRRRKRSGTCTVTEGKSEEPYNAHRNALQSNALQAEFHRWCWDGTAWHRLGSHEQLVTLRDDGNFTRTSCRQTAAATATNSRPTTLCLLIAAFAGTAGNAGPIVPVPGDAGGRPWLKCSSATQLPSTRSSCLPPPRQCNAVDSLHSILQIAHPRR
jgi:hypothetical protein